MRRTPDIISELRPDEVFVFGSNTAGRHGAGAARTALQWGAKPWKGRGLHGQTYAIPTLDDYLRQRSLEDIAADVDEFCSTAAKSHLTFLVTEVGCGLAGFTIEQMAPMFRKCVSLPNVHLPARFWEYLTNNPS